MAVRERWRVLLREELPSPPARVADLGAGTGTLTALLADEGYVVDAVDFSPAMVHLAREKNALRPKVRVIEADVSEPTLRRGAYDVV